mmetsp:Transcript_27623/g.88842  ORF Transcript_27623/g.88842 Transcript_27623/m.88842 type:complete len:213 (-) Transcript_27623:119-757(-)
MERSELSLAERLQRRKDASMPSEVKLRKEAAKPKRKSKHAPMEVSSKKSVSRFREVVPVKRKRSRDPRFDPLSGQFNEAAFERAYEFLDDYEETEAAALKKRLRKTKSQGMKEELQRELQSKEARLKSRREKRERRKALEDHIQSEKDKVKSGQKKPFFLKKSELRKQSLVAKYNKLKESGGLEKFMTKRRRKNATKEHVRIPMARRGGEQS